MKKIKLTKTAVEKLPFADKGKQVDYLDADLDGFGVRVSHTGKKYFVRRVIGAKRVRVMIGNHTLITAEDARSKAKVKLGAMEDGIDPNEVAREAKQQAEKANRKKDQADTLADALKTFLEKRRLKPNTVALYQRLFNLHLSDWLDLPAVEITAGMVNQRHTDIATGKRQRPALKKLVTAGKKGDKRTVEKAEEPRRREASADGTMRVLRAVLNYTFGDDEEAGITRVNPVRTLSRKKAWYKVGRRRRLIKNSDLPAWSKAVMAMENTVARDYLLFTLHTGLRRSETATLRWSQVDFEDATFTIPDTKNKEPHTLPLSDYLYQLLKDRKDGLKVEVEAATAAQAAASVILDTLTKKQLQTISNRVALAESRLASPYVFPGEGKTGHIVEPKRAIEAIIEATGIIFSCHDLRRTFATIAESLDLSRYTIKDLLNHKRQEDDVTGGYIILEVERLRGPMQKITNAIQERIKKQHGQVIQTKAWSD